MGSRSLIFALLAVLFMGCSSKPKMYQMRIDVASKKSNGQSWDLMGGAPDIKVLVDKKSLGLSNSCLDTYRCAYNFSSKNDRWYIEVYDSDMDSDDLIGKGECEEGEECNLGEARVVISDF